MTFLTSFFKSKSQEISTHSFVSEPILSCSSVVEIPENYPLHDLTEEQVELVRRLKQSLVDLSDKENEWCDEACMKRFLKATRWNFEEAVTRLGNTIKWRREFKPDEIDVDVLEKQAKSGKVYLNGFDKHGNAIVHMVLSKASSVDPVKGLHYSIYLMEEAFKLMPKGADKICLITDYKSMINDTPLHVSKQWITILAEHYPERLAHAFMVDPAWYVWLFFKMVGYLIDPVTKAKIHFVNTNKLPTEQPAESSDDKPEGFGQWTDLRLFVDDAQLESRLGGSFYYEFDSDTYWKAFKDLIH